MAALIKTVPSPSTSMPEGLDEIELEIESSVEIDEIPLRAAISQASSSVYWTPPTGSSRHSHLERLESTEDLGSTFSQRVKLKLPHDFRSSPEEEPSAMDLEAVNANGDQSGEAENIGDADVEDIGVKVGDDIDDIVDAVSLHMQAIDNSVSSQLGTVTEMVRQMELVSREILLNIQEPSDMTSVGIQTCWGSSTDESDEFTFDYDDVDAGEYEDDKGENEDRARDANNGRSSKSAKYAVGAGGAEGNEPDEVFGDTFESVNGSAADMSSTSESERSGVLEVEFERSYKKLRGKVPRDERSCRPSKSLRQTLSDPNLSLLQFNFSSSSHHRGINPGVDQAPPANEPPKVDAIIRSNIEDGSISRNDENDFTEMDPPFVEDAEEVFVVRQESGAKMEENSAEAEGVNQVASSEDILIEETTPGDDVRKECFVNDDDDELHSGTGDENGDREKDENRARPRSSYDSIFSLFRRYSRSLSRLFGRRGGDNDDDRVEDIGGAQSPWRRKQSSIRRLLGAKSKSSSTRSSPLSTLPRISTTTTTTVCAGTGRDFDERTTGETSESGGIQEAPTVAFRPIQTHEREVSATPSTPDAEATNNNNVDDDGVDTVENAASRGYNLASWWHHLSRSRSTRPSSSTSRFFSGSRAASLSWRNARFLCACVAPVVIIGIVIGVGLGAWYVGAVGGGISGESKKGEETGGKGRGGSGVERAGGGGGVGGGGSSGGNGVVLGSVGKKENDNGAVGESGDKEIDEKGFEESVAAEKSGRRQTEDTESAIKTNSDTSLEQNSEARAIVDTSAIGHLAEGSEGLATSAAVQPSEEDSSIQSRLGNDPASTRKASTKPWTSPAPMPERSICDGAVEAAIDVVVDGYHLLYLFRDDFVFEVEKPTNKLKSGFPRQIGRLFPDMGMLRRGEARKARDGASERDGPIVAEEGEEEEVEPTTTRFDRIGKIEAGFSVGRILHLFSGGRNFKYRMFAENASDSADSRAGFRWRRVESPKPIESEWMVPRDVEIGAALTLKTPEAFEVIFCGGKERNVCWNGLEFQAAPLRGKESFAAAIQAALLGRSDDKLTNNARGRNASLNSSTSGLNVDDELTGGLVVDAAFQEGADKVILLLENGESLALNVDGEILDGQETKNGVSVWLRDFCDGNGDSPYEGR